MTTTSRSRRLAAAAIAGVAIVSASLIATTGTAVATATKATKCSVITDDHWPSWVQGRPKGIDPHTTAAIYMWHDGDGWHIRVTHRTTNKRTFAGELATSGTFANVHAVHLERNDQLQVTGDHHVIDFLFRNYGAIDGVDFHTHCAPSISFSFQSDGSTAPPSRIVIGNNGANPSSDPFTILR